MDLIDGLYANHAHGFQRSYAVELLSADGDLPAIDAFRAQLLIRCPDVRVSELADGELFLELRTPMEGLSPSWTLGRRKAPLDARVLAMAVEQSWWWRDGERLLPPCNHSLILQDRNVAALEPPRRLELLQRILVALLEIQPCLVIHWIPTQQLVDPTELVNTYLEDNFSNPLPGGFNVRFYQIEGTEATNVPGERDFLMDTIGMTAIGGHDLQCHFRGIDPDEVSRTLYQLSLFLWDHKTVIEDGHTVAGPNEEDQWRCQHEVSISAPERDVIDLDPGFPFAAGVKDTADGN